MVHSLVGLNILLTLHSKMDTLANRWRDSVGRDTEIGGHVEATHLGDVQQLTVDHIDCKEIVMVWGLNAVKAKCNGDRDWPRAVR